MLAAAGAKSLDDLFRSIPPELRLKRPLAVPPAADEIALLAEMRRLAARNDTGHPPFIGAGAYPHHVPPVVDQLPLRGEVFTPHTPYHPHLPPAPPPPPPGPPGATLQSLFEWQTYVALLTGLDVANASMYDGASSTAEAVLMAGRITGPRKGVVSAAVHPEYQRVLRTYLASTHDEIVTLPHRQDGRPHLPALSPPLHRPP